jgi:multiple sugar transport system ATP-binding protein
MAHVVLKNIAKKYPGNSAHTIRDCTLDIADKEFIVLVGPSGCGKSTLLRMIAGLEEISAGDLYIAERRVNDIPASERDIAMVFQNYALYPHMSAYENMAFGLKRKRTPKPVIDAKVREAADLLGITALLQKKPRQLSGGERQRVALGRAIVREPKVFLMDEPLSNLDAKLRVQMRTEITKLHARLQTTFVYVTHDQTEAMTMGTRVVVLREGQIMQVDTPQGAYDHPGNLFVAQFIGSPQMNIQRGRVFCDGAYYAVALEDGTRLKTSKLIGHGTTAPGCQDKIVYWGIRPEYVQEASQNNRYTRYSEISGRIQATELIGAETYLHFDLLGQGFTARVDSHLRIKVGDRVTFHLPADCIHLFDAETQQAITA